MQNRSYLKVWIKLMFWLVFLYCFYFWVVVTTFKLAQLVAGRSYDGSGYQVGTLVIDTTCILLLLAASAVKKGSRKIALFGIGCCFIGFFLRYLEDIVFYSTTLESVIAVAPFILAFVLIILWKAWCATGATMLLEMMVGLSGPSSILRWGLLQVKRNRHGKAEEQRKDG